MFLHDYLLVFDISTVRNSALVHLVYFFDFFALKAMNVVK